MSEDEARVARAQRFDDEARVARTQRFDDEARVARTQRSDEDFMREALREAEVAESLGEVPVGAVAVKDGVIIARGHNLRERSQDPTSHAEMIALRKAAARLSSWRLEGVTIYVTLEPCPMCAGALVNGRVDRVVWGCDDPKAGATRTLYAIGADARLNHRFEMVPGVLAEECGGALRRFFGRIRGGGRPKRPRG